MDIQQQTKNVAAQGRFGDSMLLHVNPAEVKGLASAVPLTVNPETGQPEAFLPFLAPILGSMGITALAGTGFGAALGLGGLSAGALAGLGAGLATYAETGGSGSKALLSGLTAGLGTRALQGAAPATGLDPAIANAQVQAGVGTPVDPSFIGPMAPSSPTTLASQQAAGAAASGTPNAITASLNPAYNTGTAGSSLNAMFTQPGGFDAGMKNLATAAMTPSGMVAGTAAGAQGVIASQEEFERQMAQLTEDEEERKRRMYEMYPEQIPMASGGRTGFYHGGTHNPRIDAQRAANNIVFDVPDNSYSNINYGLDGIGGFNSYTTPARRRTRPIDSGFMPGFMPEYSYFEGMNPSATALGYDPLGNFQNPQSYQEGYSQPSRGRGGFLGGLFGRGRGMQPMPPRGGFRNEDGSGFTPPPPPQFAGYGNPFMQSASYQGFYGVPQMQQMINPYAAFSQMPMPYQPYQPYQPPVETPPDDGGTPPDDGGGTGGGGTLPIDPPIDINRDGLGRKGAVTNPDPIAPTDDFVNPIVNPPVGGPAEPPMTPPITMPPMPPSIGRPGEPPINVPGGTPGFYDRPTPSLPDPIAPPPTITIPIEGGADVTIPDFSRPQPPRLEPPMSIGGPGGGMADLRIEPPIQPLVPGSAAPTPQTGLSAAELLELSDEELRKYIPRSNVGNMYTSYDNTPSPEEFRKGLQAEINPSPDDLKMQLGGPRRYNLLYENPIVGRRPPTSINREPNLIAQPNLRASAGNQQLNISSQPAIALPDVPTMPMTSINTDIQGTLPEPKLNPVTGNMEQPLSEFKPIAPPPIAPPVQSVTTPQPFLQQPQAPQTGGIPVTGGGPLGSGILPVANLPSGPTAPSGPVDPRIGAGIKIPTGPAMGGISAVPTPAAPPQNVGNNPPPMSIGGPGGGRGGIFGAPMFAEGGDTSKELPNEGLKALAKTEKGREAVEAMGYQEGGATDMMQDPVTQNVIMFILGETDDENAINAFVEKYGAEQFMFLRDKILKQAAGNPDAQTEGLIQGDGNSGMADDLPGVIGNKEKIAVSQDEFIVPADVVSMLGDGSSDAGSKQLYNMMDRVRQAKTGGTTQAPPLNPQKVLPA